MMNLSELQENMVQALYKDDTDKSLLEFQNKLADVGDDPSCINADGWRLSHLLILKLRFERLTQALPSLLTDFHNDQKAFLSMFQEYNKLSPAKAFFPTEEKELFLEFYRNYKGL